MEYLCSLCGKTVQGDAVEFINHTETRIIDEIKANHPEWEEKDGVCRKCVEYFRRQLKGEE
ncbi:MAG: hypothetical protein KC733_02525 [Candidatus Omnitrophica bacterium]|nr:hypothetical protein [Candidatus Omnitrophota bacterium]